MTTTAPTRPAPVRPRRRRWPSAALAVVLVAGGVWAGHWWTHPTAFRTEGYGGSFVMDPRPLQDFPGLLTTGPLATDSETVTLGDVRHAWRSNETGSRLEVYVCTSPQDGGWFGPWSRTDSRYDRLCSDLRPAVPGTTMRLGPEGGDQLVYRVSPRREGRSELDWIEVTYRRGAAHLFQRGTQRIEERSTIRVGTTNQ